MPTSTRTRPALPEPWNSFLRDVDSGLSEAVQLHCLGGFVLCVCWGLPRPTGDVDFISVEPIQVAGTLETLAGRGSKISEKYGLHLQYVTVADVPENYEERLVEICPGMLSHLRLFALELHDVILAKLVRNHPVDLEDAKFVSKKDLLDRSVLRDRYHGELRPYLANQERHDLTLRLWLEACFES